MSLKQLFDTPEECAYWFSALARLSDAISVSTIVSGNGYFALISIATGVIGREVAGYYKLQIMPREDTTTTKIE